MAYRSSEESYRRAIYIYALLIGRSIYVPFTLGENVSDNTAGQKKDNECRRKIRASTSIHYCKRVAIADKGQP